MDISFRDRKAKVLVVDTSGASRTLVVEVIRGMGFQDIQGVANIKDAIGVLEVEAVEWMVSPMFSDQEENLLQILELVSSYPELRQLHISALLDESEHDLIPVAFEKGLLSYHRKPFTKDSLTNEMKELFSRYEHYQWQSFPLASSYLRQHLQHIGQFEELLALERQLLKLVPSDLVQYMNLVVPLAKNGKADEAKALLVQLRKLEPSLEAQIKTLATDYFSGESLEGENIPGINILGIKTVLAVDGDSAVQHELKAVLEELGVENVQVFGDGEAALAYIRANGRPDLVIQEWRIPRLTGPLLLQKAQEEGARTTPFILHTSLLQKEDTPFVREMGVVQVVPKPLERKELIRSILWAIQQDRQPTEQRTMERKIRQFLAEGNLAEARPLKDRFMRDPSFHPGAKDTIEAEFAFTENDFEKARDYSIDAIKHAGESIFILNLLGKTMIALREFETALKCFQKAQNLAPMNLERLCQIAEIHSELGDHDKANEILERVQDMDPDSERARESAAKVAINAGEGSSVARKIMGQLRAVDNVVSYMNNQAVALARCGMINEGIEQYKKTLDAVPLERPDIRGIVCYNLALAHLRSHQIQEAKEVLQLCIECKDSKVYKRAELLHKKVTLAIEKGLQVTLASSAPSEVPVGKTELSPDEKVAMDEAKEIAKSKVLAAVGLQPGDMACYLIYKTGIESPRAQKMLEILIRFNPRKAIERQESMGADRLIASSQ